MTIWRMCIACWIKKITNTYSRYVTLIAFSEQQWLHESVSLLHYTYNFFYVRVNLFRQFSDPAYLLTMNINYEEVNCSNCVKVKLILMLRASFLATFKKVILNFKSWRRNVKFYLGQRVLDAVSRHYRE